MPIRLFSLVYASELHSRVTTAIRFGGGGGGGKGNAKFEYGQAVFFMQFFEQFDERPLCHSYPPHPHHGA